MPTVWNGASPDGTPDHVLQENHLELRDPRPTEPKSPWGACSTSCQADTIGPHHSPPSQSSGAQKIIRHELPLSLVLGTPAGHWMGALDSCEISRPEPLAQHRLASASRREAAPLGPGKPGSALPLCSSRGLQASGQVHASPFLPDLSHQGLRADRVASSSEFELPGQTKAGWACPS